MLETGLLWQIGCSINLWFQHNGEVINRIMGGKQRVLHVFFSLGGFQISQAECNTVSALWEESLGPTARLLVKRKRKAAPIKGCENLNFWNSSFK